MGVKFTPAAEGHGLCPWMNAPAFGRPVPSLDGGCRPAGAWSRVPRAMPVGLHKQKFF